MRFKMLAIPLIAAVTLLAGCTPGTPVSIGATEPASNGVENLAPDEIVDKAVDALVGASSFRVAGVFGSGTFAATADLIYTDNEVKGNGTFLGLGVELIKAGQDLYLKADPSFFSQFVPEDQQSVLVTIANTWVTVPAAWVTILVPVPLSTDAVAGEFAPVAPLTKGETGAIAGTPVITVTDADGTVYSVATTGEPYLMKVEYANGNGVNFSSFNESVTIEAPEGAKDILELLGMSNG
jgi:hypothetical protein